MNKKLTTAVIAASLCVLAAVPAFAAPKNADRAAYRQAKSEINSQLSTANQELKQVRAEIKDYSAALKAFNEAKKAGTATLPQETIKQIRALRLEIKEIRGKQTKPAAQVSEAEVSVEQALEIDVEEEAEIMETVADDTDVEAGPVDELTDVVSEAVESTSEKTNEVKQLRLKAKDAAANGDYESAKSYLNNAVSIRSQKLDQLRRIRDKWVQINALLPAEYRK